MIIAFPATSMCKSKFLNISFSLISNFVCCFVFSTSHTILYSYQSISYSPSTPLNSKPLVLLLRRFILSRVSSPSPPKNGQISLIPHLVKNQDLPHNYFLWYVYIRLSGSSSITNYQLFYNYRCSSSSTPLQITFSRQ